MGYYLAQKSNIKFLTGDKWSKAWKALNLLPETKLSAEQ